jgi:hypothetical protein
MMSGTFFVVKELRELGHLYRDASEAERASVVSGAR